MNWDLLLTDCRAATMSPGALAYGAIEDAAIGIAEGRIAWIGRRQDMPKAIVKEAARLGGRWVTPGLIDCHTHLVYGGDRAAEFELRLKGASYEEIAKAGGGIASTVKATRTAGIEDLVASAALRLAGLMGEGVTAIEIKSGYGLDLENERKQLRAARRLGEAGLVTVRTTCLAAHALPPEFAGDSDGYIEAVCTDILPAIAADKLADAVDAFCEKIAFTPAQTRRVFETARGLGLPVKLHAEQLSDQGGAQLAAEFSAISCDHLEYVSEAGIAAMAKAGSVAVLLPGAFYALRETKLPPVDGFRRAGVPMALSTDHNPGTSPTLSLLLMLSMGCTFFRLTPEEALTGVTRHAAQALGLGASHGQLKPGMAADLAIWSVERPAELGYWFGANPCAGIVKNGGWVKRCA
ncbi:imidazolonepropionase [Dongia mobilis]|uniref:Imidazolonepropionase n=1 Tax=Dongia mobilis TaxID=578943 RepID=A0A4R6WUF3_9PROT|nr:imidazolonepropionase [Dongia mobilis]TDQ80558.1 imidazolonepropionase [Dongia mobilis]